MLALLTMVAAFVIGNSGGPMGGTVRQAHGFTLGTIAALFLVGSVLAALLRQLTAEIRALASRGRS